MEDPESSSPPIDPATDVVDRKESNIYLFGDINDYSASQVVRGILISNKEKPEEPVKIFINSGGGSVSSLFAIYDAIWNLSTTPVHTIALGNVCSAAGVLLVSGHKRFAGPSSWFFFHQMITSFEGDIKSLGIHGDLSKRWMNRLEEILGSHTNKPKSFWTGVGKNQSELWLNAKQMKSYGIVDEILPALHRKRNH